MHGMLRGVKGTAPPCRCWHMWHVACRIMCVPHDMQGSRLVFLALEVGISSTLQQARCAAQLSAIVDIQAYLTAWSCDLAGAGLQLSAIVEMWVFGHTDMLLYSENANYPMASYVSRVNA